MSQEDVEMVRRAYEASALGDSEGALEPIAPQIETRDHDIPDASQYHGHEGMFRWQADWESSWESWRWEPEEFVAAGDRVVAVLRVHAKGRESGVEIERLDGAVWTMRNGKGIRLDYLSSKAEALEAVGLEYAESRGNVVVMW